MVLAAPARITEIRQQPRKLLGLLAGGIVMTAASLFVATLRTGRRGQPLSDFALILYGAIGGFGVLFFGAATLVILWRILGFGGPTIVVTPAGIWDRRLTRALVPWSAVTGLRTFSYGAEHTIVLVIDPKAEADLTLTRAARWGQSLIALIGAHGLAIKTNNLDMSHADLYALIESHLAAHGRASRAATND